MKRIIKIFADKLPAKNSSARNARNRWLRILWSIGVLISFLLGIYNQFISSVDRCLICDLALVSVAALGFLCAVNKKDYCAVNLSFTFPLFVYAYFISDFRNHPPLEDTLFHSLGIIYLGYAMLSIFTKERSVLRLYVVFGMFTLGFQMFKAGILVDQFLVFSRIPANPILVFGVIALFTSILRNLLVKEKEQVNSRLNEMQQSVVKVFQDSHSPVAQLKAERDEEGNIVNLYIEKVNNAFESIFKINLYEVQDQKANYIFELLFKNNFDVNEIIHFKRKRTKEFHAKNFDRWINTHLLTPSYNSFILVFEDITRVKQKLATLEESKRRYKVLLEAIPDIFFVIDKDGTYEDFVVKESDLFKIEDANIIGSTIYDVGFPDNMAQKIYACIQTVIHNNTIENIEYSLNTPNGTFLYEMRLARLNSNAVISVARDITKRKTAEFNLEKALVKAEESDRLKSAFLANLSHEIRTPMNVITNFTRILAETELDPEDKLEISEAITQNGQQLLNMIDNTIHLSKIETHAVEVNKQFCHINNLLREVYNKHYPHLPDSKSVKLNLKLHVRNQDYGFVTDQHLLGEAISILVDNAIKYTLQGEINISYEMVRNELVKFTVSDTGIGIPSEESENIFNRFYRLSNNINETTSGSGLGLNIAQHYVSMLGGKLEFESKQHVGTKFYFTLPFEKGKGFMMLVS